MAAARKTEVLAHRLTHYLAARIQYAGDDGGVELGNAPLHRGATVHHRDARHAGVVLYGEALARQEPRIGPLDRTPPVPGVEGVLLGSRTISARARVLNR